MKKVLAIAFSDLHINDFTKFNKDNERTLNHFRVIFLIRDLCKKYKCPAIFCGDLFHKPEIISNDLLNTTIDNFSKLDSDFKIYAISGNHDMDKSNTFDNKSSSWLKTLSKVYKFLECIDYTSISLKGFTIHGVPYIDHNIGLNTYLKKLKLSDDKPNILVLHTDYPGAKDTDGTEVNTVENLNTNILSRFDLVLMGHIHKPQRLSKKVYMIGAPLQQRRTDRDCKLGYWIIYEDLTLKFIPFDNFPRFIDVSSENEIVEDGNYYTVIQNYTPSNNATEVNKITRNISKKRVVRRYLKEKGINDVKKRDLLYSIIKEVDND